MSRLQIITNEWIDAANQKPWTMRNVLVRLDNGRMDVAYWNGDHWCTQCGTSYHAEITHFYVFERLIPKEHEDDRL